MEARVSPAVYILRATAEGVKGGVRLPVAGSVISGRGGRHGT
jgi:hypothetical protein